MLMATILMGFLALAAGAQSVPATKSAEGPQQQIQQVLDAQTAAWNRGDVGGYMAGYWKSPELTFFSNATETKGWQPTLERYKARYQGTGRGMGTVSFPQMRITLLSEDAAFVRGEWQLAMPDGKMPHGMFTLIFRKFPEGWRIVHDHSSGE